MGNFGILIAICVIAVILFATIVAILSRYRKCPSDKILVVYGKVGTDEFGNPRSAKCIHGFHCAGHPVLSVPRPDAHLDEC